MTGRPPGPGASGLQRQQRRRLHRSTAGVVVGGLFTSTLLTLILVPVLYSEASRFTCARTNRELDTMLDDAQARRFGSGGGR